MRQNDEFTLSLLTNEKALKINRTGTEPHLLFRTKTGTAWADTAEDGTRYIALFNLSSRQTTVRAYSGAGAGTVFTDAWTGKQAVADLDSSVCFRLPVHGAALLYAEA